MPHRHPVDVLVIEDNSDGHRLSYVGLIADEVLRRGERPAVLTVPTVLESPEFAQHLARRSLAVVTHDPGWRRLVQGMRRCRPSLVVVPDADARLLTLALTVLMHPRLQFRLLIMRNPRNILSGKPTWRDRAKFAIKSLTVQAVARLPNVGLLTLASAGSREASKPGYVADPIVMSSTPQAVANLRREWDLDDSRYWFGIIGAIDERKNVSLVMAAAQGLPPGQVGLLVAGRFSDATRESLREFGAEFPGGVRLVDRVLTDEELDAAVAAVDCVVLAHSNEGPSGLFGKAVRGGTRILGAGAQSLRRDCEERPGDAQWVPLTRADLQRGMAEALLRPRPAPVEGTPASEFGARLLAGR